ncbi:MAG: helix-turn-helix domain-containing GNAT family N-acetyltransferase [Actinomycetota bacterium]
MATLDVTPAPPGEVATVRRFNRLVTERVGALDDHYLDRGRPLGASRLLWEIGSGHEDLRALRARLGLDSGYLSRLLRSLEGEGLVAVEPAPTDRRVRVTRLTASGRTEWAVLDAASDELADAMLAPLDDDDRHRLLEAMETVRSLLGAGLVEIAIEDPTSADARYCLAQYFAELDRRFDAGFDPSITGTADPDEVTGDAGALLVARRGGEPVGCGALKRIDETTADIKRMWVSPSARGLGLGRRLVDALEREAATRGFERVRLDTNRALVEAIALYRAMGYDEVEPFNTEPFAHHWFAKTL